jgi:hypothetical protein
MSVREFGFICGDVSIEGGGDGLVLPRSEEAYLTRSLIPGGVEAELTGRYLLRVYLKGSVVYKAKVEVAWDAQASQPEPSLGMKVADAASLSEALGKVGSNPVELRFTRITS